MKLPRRKLIQPRNLVEKQAAKLAVRSPESQLEEKQAIKFLESLDQSQKTLKLQESLLVARLEAKLVGRLVAKIKLRLALRLTKRPADSL